MLSKNISIYQYFYSAFIKSFMWYARIGVFQSAKFKSFNKVYIGLSVKLGNQVLSAAYLLICALALLLMYASVIFNLSSLYF